MPTSSVCPLDCPDRCRLEVTVAGGRVVEIDGDHDHPFTSGFICGKVRGFTKRMYGPDRLLHPMRRTGPKGSGAFERVTWDAAIDHVAERLAAIRRERGGEAILPFYYGGSNGLLTQGTADARLFAALGASRLATTVCAAPTGAVTRALYGKMASIDPADLEAARFILIWGANPRDSNIHLVPLLKRAREAGARIAVVDPRATPGGRHAEMHLPIFPGSDAAVALAMIGHLDRIGAVDRGFLKTHATGWEKLLDHARAWTLERAAERARVPAHDIAAIAEAYADADPALVRCGWGLERNRNGEASVAAVLALPAVAGKFGKRGGGYMMSASGAYRVNDRVQSAAAESGTRIINMNHLGRALLGQTPPIQALFVYNANPVVTIPDQNRVLDGMRREDLFTVVFDQVMTDTAQYGDVLLPATTFLEHRELSTSYGTYGVMLAEPVVAPVGEARSNEDVFTAIGERMGFAGRRGEAGGWPRGDDQLELSVRAIEGPLAGADPGARVERLRRGEALPFDFPGERPVQFATVRPRTADSKAHLWPAELGAEPYRVLPDPGDARHPLALISPSSDRTISSSLAEYGFREARLEMHPDDARVRSLADGDTVRVHNDLGEVIVGLHLSGDLRPGVVSLPKGLWNRHTRNGSVSNALVPDWVSAVSGGACFNDARVEVSRHDDAAPLGAAQAGAQRRTSP
jgi:anaerobic selenocysteine-containing dehydrogenase